MHIEATETTKYGQSNSWGPSKANAAHEQKKIGKNKARNT